MKKFDVKNDPGSKPEDLLHMTPMLLIALGYFQNFCAVNNINCMVTNVTHRFPSSKSNTHPEGRAVDVRAHNFTDEQVDQVIAYMDQQVGDLGAYSLTDGAQRVIIYHDIGLGPHFHIQVKRGNL